METSSGMRWTWYIALASVSLCPLVMTRWVANCFQTPKYALLVTLGLPLTFLAVLDLSRQRLDSAQARPGLSWWERGVLLRWATLTVATAASISLPISFWGDPGRCHGLIARFLTLGIALVVYRCIQEDPKRIRQLLMALVLSSLPVSFYALFQAAGWDPLLPENPHERPFSTLGNAAFLGDVMQFAFFSAWGLLLTEKRLRVRILWLTAGTAAGLALLTTLTRSAWLGTGSALCLSIVLLAKSRPLRKQIPGLSRSFLWVLPSVALSLFFLSFTGYGRQIFQRVIQTASLDFTGTGRLLIWKDACQVAKDHWLNGSGLETFALAFLPETSLGLARFNPLTRYDNAHCEFLNCLCTEGILGLSTYLFLGCIGLRGLWRSFRQASHPFLSLALLASLVAHMASGFFNFDIVATSLLWYTFLAAGAAMGPTKDIPSFSVGTMSKLAAGALFLLGTIFSGRLLWADHLSSLANGYLFAGNAKKAKIYARRASRLIPWNADYKIVLADSLGPDHEETVQLYDRVLKKRSSPQVDWILEKKISYQLTKGRPEAALASLDKLLRLAPYSSTAHLLGVHTFVGLSRFEEALWALEQARFLDPWNDHSLTLERKIAPLFKCAADKKGLHPIGRQQIHPIRLAINSPSSALVLFGKPGTALSCAPASSTPTQELFFPLFRSDSAWSTHFHLFPVMENEDSAQCQFFSKEGILLGEDTLDLSPKGYWPFSQEAPGVHQSGWIKIRTHVPVYGWQLLKGHLGEQVVMAPSKETTEAGLPLPVHEKDSWLGISLVNPSERFLEYRLHLFDSSGRPVFEERKALGPRAQRLLVDGKDLPTRESNRFLSLQGNRPFHIQAVLGGSSDGTAFACGLSDLSLKSHALFPLLEARYGGSSHLFAANPDPVREASLICSVFREEQVVQKIHAVNIPPQSVIDLISTVGVHQEFGVQIRSSLPLSFLGIVDWKKGPRPGIVATTGEVSATSLMAPFPQAEASGFLALLPSEGAWSRIRLIPFEQQPSPCRAMDFHFRGRLLLPTPFSTQSHSYSHL